MIKLKLIERNVLSSYFTKDLYVKYFSEILMITYKLMKSMWVFHGVTTYGRKNFISISKLLCFNWNYNFLMLYLTQLNVLFNPRLKEYRPHIPINRLKQRSVNEIFTTLLEEAFFRFSWHISNDKRPFAYHL